MDSSICSDSKVSLSCLGAVSKGFLVGLNTSYDVFKSSLKLCAEIKYQMDRSQLGCIVTSERQLAAFFNHSASKHTQLVSKLVLDFWNHRSDMQVGYQYSLHKGQLRIAVTTSGVFQSYVVRSVFKV